MILYSLICESGHQFESWFRDSGAYDDSAARGLVSCPSCRSSHVTKAIMAPAIARGSVPPVEASRPAEMSASSETEATQKPSQGEPKREVALLDESSRELRALLRGVRDKVLAQGHDVGPRFAAEARRIHDGEAAARQIFGQASIAEARDLIEEGIPILPLPIVPDELN